MLKGGQSLIFLVKLLMSFLFVPIKVVIFNYVEVSKGDFSQSLS